MSKEFDLLILERVSESLKTIKHEEDGSVILEGTFGEIGVRNKNNRIYTEEQYLPQVQALQEKIGKFKLLGELDHPKQFDVQLSNASHVIEKLEYDKDSQKIRGRIRLLNTPKGKTAQALIKDGIPLHISSRAAGSVDEKGMVEMKKLFTYDLVADPGFENAELNRVNENYGYSNDDNLFIYEINSFDNELNSEDNDDKYKNTDIQMEKNTNPEFVTQEDFIKYSTYVKDQLDEIKKSKNESVSDFDSEKFVEYVNLLTERLNNVTSYMKHLAETLDAEIDFKNDIVENLKNIKKFNNYLATTLDTTITEKIELQERLSSIIENVDLLEEEMEYNIEYTKYLANETDKGLQYMEHVANRADEGLQYSEYLASLINENTKDGIFVKEELSSVIEYNEYIKENLENVASYSNGLGQKVNQIIDTVNEGIEGEEENVENTVKESTESIYDYRNSIDEKLQTIIESAKKQKAETEDYGFLNLLEANYRNEFMGLDVEKKKEVIQKFKDSDYRTKVDVKKIYESTVHPELKRLDYIENMPEAYKQLWENLSEEGKSRIQAQAEYHKLDTQYQINNFWQTRDLRTQKVELKPINESEEVISKTNKVSSQYMENFESEMKRRFRK